MTLVALAQLGRGVVPVDTPVLHADDEGVLRGRSVFETLRVYGGMPFMLSAHLDRLLASAGRLRLAPPPRDAFEQAVFDAIAAGGELDASLRLLWTAGREGGGEPTGLVLVSSLPPGLDELRARGLRLAVVHWAPGALAGAKSTSYAENIAAQGDAAERGGDDALLVAPDGTVLEAPTSNVWFREGHLSARPAARRGRGVSHVFGAGGRSGRRDRRGARRRRRARPGRRRPAARSAGGRGLR